MRSKRYQTAQKKIDPKKTYPLEEAIKLVKESSNEKFDASIELHLNLGIDPSKGDQQVRGTITLPHGVGGKAKKVAAFIEPAKEEEAKKAGADIIGNEEMIDKILKKGLIEFDVAIATPTMMPKLAKLARILGPRGIMPNPKTDTVGANIEKMIKEQKAGKQNFKTDNTANIHQIFSRISFDEQKTLENLEALLTTIKKLKPNSSKGIYIKNASISSSMGPGIKIEV